MDDFPAKAIRINELDGVLDRRVDARAPGPWPDGEDRCHEAPVAAAVRSNGAEPVLDAAMLEQLKDTLPPPIRARLLATFERQLDTCLEGIAQAQARGDAEACRRLAHLLKGSSATIGARRLGARCQALESRAAERAIDAEELAELRAAAAEARPELRQQLL
jgi:HPt (histidine-containing phosphotransfer) domain-containing protein